MSEILVYWEITSLLLNHFCLPFQKTNKIQNVSSVIVVYYAVVAHMP